MLLLPNTLASDLKLLCSTATLHSVSCIDVGSEVLGRISSRVHPTYSCFAKAPISLLLPHCLGGFKALAIEGSVSERQVLIGMVSALYQRRALGFPGHFVFGISHRRGCNVNVLAARWETVVKPGTNTVADRIEHSSGMDDGLSSPPADAPGQPNVSEGVSHYLAIHNSVI